MAVIIGQSSIDERGKAAGGVAGDQTGREVGIRNWYAQKWSVLLRPKDAGVAERMARACEAGCRNDNIGYDQNQRNTLRAKARAAGWDLSAITTPCECDCSSFMSVCAEAAGVDMSGAYTGSNAPVTANMRSRFKATGAFDVLTDSKYLTKSDYLMRGDILVYEGHHTVMVLSNGEKVREEDEDMTGEEIVKKINEYTATLTLPDWARKEFDEAVKLGITDGANPMGLVPRYQAAIMAKRAAEANK